MPTKCYKLYATGTVSTNAAAQLIISRGGTIKAINFAAAHSSAANSDAVTCEVSLTNVAQTTVNDTGRGPIAELKFWTNAITAASVFEGSKNVSIPVSCPVADNDRVYLNVVRSGAGTWIFAVFIWVEEGR